MRNAGEKYKALILYILFLTPLLLPSPSGAEPSLKPERFEFDLKWNGIRAGRAALEIIDEGDTARFVSTADSVNWVSIFYKVRDRIESTVGPDMRPSRYHIKLHEGRNRRNKEVLFDQKAGRADFINHLNGERKSYELPERAFDPLSAFFYLRTLKLEVGKPLFIKVFDSKKLWDVEIKVLRKERIKTVLGAVDTIVVKPLMKSEGLFYKKGDVLIWITDDGRRIPVRMKSKISIGSVVSVLTGGKFEGAPVPKSEKKPKAEAGLTKTEKSE